MGMNDDTLIAYLDGELDAEGFAAVEAALAADPALARRLDQLADSDQRVRRSYQAVLEDPVPPALIAAVLNAPDPCDRPVTRAQEGRRVPAPGGGPGQFIGSLWSALTGRGAMALASVALVALGALLAWTLQGPADAGWALRAGEPIAERSLLVALETAPSGREVEAAGRQYHLLATFERLDGGVCREFNASGNSGDAADHLGVACRLPGGGWELVVLASEERPTDPAHGGYRTASERQFELVDAWRLTQTRGTPLAPGQERELIDRGWRR
jgi:hypothetical protein